MSGRGVEIARGVAMAALRPLERRLLASHAGATAPPPLFVVGPPRSGTTLLYELLVTRFRLAWVSNLAHRLYATPLAATRLGRPWITRWRGDFTSRYGHVAGWGAPSEAGWVWLRWLPEPDPLPPSLADGLPLAEMRATVAGLSDLLGGPFVSKNVMHSVRVSLLDRVYPGCGFLEVVRDPADNVRSIVAAERAGGGHTEDGWWSVRPRGWEPFAGEDAVVRGAAQVRLVSDQIGSEARALGAGRHLRVPYERLCREPRAVLDEIGRFAAGLGCEVATRGDVPDRFERDGRRAPDASESDAIRRAVERVDATLGV